MTPADALAADARQVSEDVARLCSEQGRSVAAAESLTGGKISCHLGSAPSSATWFRGALVAYASEVKFDVLGVPEGPVVTKECAAAMAGGVARLLGADVTVAVTGVGGPGEEEGHPAGTVWFGLAVDGQVRTELHRFAGEPSDILDATTLHALRLLRAGLAARGRT